MKLTRRHWLGMAVLAGGGALAGAWWSRRSADQAVDGAVLQARFPDLEGRPQSLSQWGNRVLLLNFWATWCEPCKEEIPLLAQTQERRGNKLQVIGIAIDSAANVREYASKMNIPYPLLVGDIAALNLMRSQGNAAGALPFSLVIGADGKVMQRHLGIFTAPQLAAIAG